MLRRCRVTVGKRDGVEVRLRKIAAGSAIQQSNLRTLFCGGQDWPALTWDCETIWRELYDEARGVWMTDLPIEQRQMEAQTEGLEGRVLVGGLGLGVVVRILLETDLVDDITVVESDQRIIDLVGPTLLDEFGDESLEIIHADLFNFLRERDPDAAAWDCAFFDIWQSDGESTFHEVVVPLRELAVPHVDGRIACWNEDVMRGQLALGLSQKLMFATMPEEARAMMGAGVERMSVAALARPMPEVGAHWDWSVAFFAAIMDGRIPTIDDAGDFAPYFAGAYWEGPEWESVWDHFLYVTGGTRDGLAKWRGE
jgi:hypothetical protein